MMVELLRGGFDGAIYPVNPGYDEVLGIRCYPSIADVPEPVDLAILGVANAPRRTGVARCRRGRRALGGHVLVAVRGRASRAGAAAADASASPRSRATPGIAMCGGNGMGFLNLETDLRATGFATPDDIRRGPVTFVSHSGSAFAAVAFNDRGIGFNLIVSSGQETRHRRWPTTWSTRSGRPSTRVLALLLETVRDPRRVPGRAGARRRARTCR